MTETLLTQMGIIVVMVGSPGPNNFLLMHSGAHFGVRGTLALLTGIIAGCLSMLLVLIGGLQPLLNQYPQSLSLLRFLCLAALCYLIVLLLRASDHRTPDAAPVARLGFWRGAGFQWINPKAWMMCLALLTARPASAISVSDNLWTLAVFTALAAPLLALWSTAGQALSGWLTQGARMRGFNRAMAALLGVAALFMLYGSQI